MRKTIQILLCGLLVASGQTMAAAQRSPAMEVYHRVTEDREKYDKVVWQNAPATEAELRNIITEYGNSIKMLDEPLNRDLGEGNLYLRYRRYNLLVDLVKLNARIGQNEQAFKHWNELLQMDWSNEPNTSLTEDPNVIKLMALPGYEAIRNKHDAAHWWLGAPAFNGTYREQLPVEERIAGLSRIWSVAREGFVWFDHVPALDWDKSYLAYLPKVIATSDTEAYYRVLVEFVAQLKDGHSNVYFPEALENRIYARPGIRTRLVEGKVLVTRIADENLKQQGLVVGDEVVAIDGEDVFAYAKNRVEPFESSSTPQDMEVRKFSYGLLSGDSKVPVKLRLKNRKGKQYELSAPRSGFTFITAPQKPVFELRKDGVAIVRATQFENDEALKVFEAHLPEILSAKGLILDLRGNGGGSSRYGWNILTYLSDKPLKSTAAFYRENPLLDLAQAPSPSIRWRASSDSDYDAKRKEVFKGPVVMLIDALSFSAAEDTAAAYKIMKRGKLIGMPSGGSTGQPYMFSLPGGGSARICVKRDTYPDGSNFVGVGVLPDITAGLTVADVRQGSDSVMEIAAKQLLKK